MSGTTENATCIRCRVHSGTGMVAVAYSVHEAPLSVPRQRGIGSDMSTPTQSATPRGCYQHPPGLRFVFKILSETVLPRGLASIFDHHSCKADRLDCWSLVVQVNRGLRGFPRGVGEGRQVLPVYAHPRGVPVAYGTADGHAEHLQGVPRLRLRQ